jgi:SAM-dependent methyltransferase
MRLPGTNFKVSYAYPLGYPIKVVIRSFGIRALLGWLFQKYAATHKTEEVLISERIVELPLTHQWFGNSFRDSKVEVLEIGHVASSMSLEFASLGHKVTGIDLRSYKFTHPNLTSLTGDFLEYEFKKSFDCIYSLSTIEHFGFTNRYDNKEDIDNHLDEDAFAKIASLLKDSGRAIISVPYAQKSSPNTWFRIYTRQDLKTKLEKHFKVLSSQFYQRKNNQWTESLDISSDPVSARDGVAIFLLSKRI